MIHLTVKQTSRYQAYLAKLEEKKAEQEKWVNDAASQGDLAENSEFDAARLELAKTRSRIDKINNILSDFEQIETSKDPYVISIGSLIRLRIANTGIKSLEDGEWFELVETSDIVIPDSKTADLSIHSLVGRQLFNRKFNPNNKTGNTVFYSDFDNIERSLEILDVSIDDIPDEDSEDSKGVVADGTYSS